MGEGSLRKRKREDKGGEDGRSIGSHEPQTMNLQQQANLPRAGRRGERGPALLGLRLGHANYSLNRSNINTIQKYENMFFKSLNYFYLW